MTHSQLLLGAAPLEEQVKLPHDFGDVFLPINRIQFFDPLPPSFLQQLINVARSIPPPLSAASKDFSSANTFNLPLPNLLNALFSLQFRCFRCHLFAGVVLPAV